MKFKEFLQENQLLEAPLPDDWDKDKFKKGASFKETVSYAQERAAKIGTGSSRVAFVIPFEGRQTVLKVAKNKKGIAQNLQEVGYLDDGYASQIGLLIPIIDYDESNGDDIKWIHVEKAEKITDKDFIKYTGGLGCGELVSYCRNQVHGRIYYPAADKKTIDAALEYCEENDVDLINNLIDFLHTFDDKDKMSGDLTRVANWGMYKGHPVIIDIGFDDVTAKLYSRA